MSRSQQDLTLSDLEPDNILKPQPKSFKADAEEEKIQKVAEPQFMHPSSSWCHSVIDDFRKNEQNIHLTPSPSMNIIGVTTESSLDHAASACQENCVGLSPISGPVHDLSQDSITGDQDSASSSNRKSSGKDKNRRSPSPKKILRSGSFRKSASKSADNGGRKLIIEDDPEMDDRANAFSNPVVESEWATFVGHSNAEDFSSEAQESPVTNAPESLTIDRGDYEAPCSPYRGDYICLLEQTDSPAQARSKAVASPDVSEWSAQSTPDHTTRLLKGIQSPVHHRSAKSHPVKFSTFDTSYGKDLPGELESEEIEEVLRVEKEGDRIVVTTKVENTRDSNIPNTGFDFLDNW